MTKLLAASALGAVLSLAAVADANAWTRDRSFHGPRGSASLHGSGSCSGGSCSRSMVRTGPYGRTFSREGSASCSGGTCSGSRTTTGPAGRTWTREGSISR